MPVNIPFAPSGVYQPDSSIAQLILQAGNQRAEGQRQNGLITASVINNLGNLASDYFKQKQMAPLLAARTAAEQNQAELGKFQLQDARHNQGARQAMNTALGGSKLDADTIRKSLSDAGFADKIPEALNSLSMMDEHAAKAQEAQQKAQDAQDDYLGNLGDNVLKAFKENPNQGMIFAQGAIAHAAQLYPKEAQMISAQLTQDPTKLPALASELRSRSKTLRAEDEKRAAEANKPLVAGPNVIRPGAPGEKPTILFSDDSAEKEKAAALAETIRHNRATEAAAGGGVFAGAGGPASTPKAGLTGDAYLQTLDPKIASQVKAYAEGRMPIPQGFALKSPYFQQLMQAVSQYDPTFDAVNYGGRSKTRNDFTAGNSAKQITALNTVVGHLGDLSSKVSNLDNTDIPVVNSVKNWLKTATGSSDVTNFNTVKKGVQDELTRVWRQAGGSEQDIKTWGESLNSAGSPEQLHGVLQTIGGMLESRLSALENQKQQGMGAFGNDIKVLTPESRKTLSLLESRASGNESKASAGGWVLGSDGVWVRK